MDVDEIKEAFFKNFTVLDWLDVDGRNNPSSAVPDVWEMAAGKWNDPCFNPVSAKYGFLHKDFVEEIDSSHKEIEEIAPLTGEKAKAKFNKLKNELLIVKCNWERSGNGYGSLRKVSASLDDKDEYELMNANDKANFMNRVSSVVLYLWEKGEENQLLSTICQKLPEGVGFDTASCETTERRKKRIEEENNIEKKIIIYWKLYMPQSKNQTR